ncbi:MAG: hypothetical protein WCK37_03130 [Candidatus Falkowbacteria bacterium]
MKSFLTIALFLGLTLFCVYWFGQKNITDRDFSKIPVVGSVATKIFYNRFDIWDYISRSPVEILQGLGFKFDPQKTVESIKSNAGSDLNSLQKIYQAKP